MPNDAAVVELPLHEAPPLTYALLYARTGYRVIPVHELHEGCCTCGRRDCPSPGKHPRTKNGAHDSSCDPDVIRAWWRRDPTANIGLTLDGFVVVDIDPRNEGDVRNLPGTLPDTCHARTGGGGWHYLYRARDGAEYPSKIPPGIDVKKGAGSYILVEPSVTASKYCWLDEREPWAARPAEAPRWLEDAKDDPPPKPGASGSNVVREGGRNDRLIREAGRLRRLGLSREVIEAALQRINVEICNPPLDQKEVAGIAESAARYDPAVAIAAEWPAPIDLQVFARSSPPAPAHIIAPWLPAGEVTLLAGHGGSGKSAISLHLGACLHLGLPWHGLKTAKRRVLYVSAEDPAAIIHWRLSRIVAHMGIDMAQLDGLRIIDASSIGAELFVETRDGGQLSAMYDTLRELAADSDVLILDGASDMFDASEIARRYVRSFIRALRRLIKPDGAVLLLSHIDKAIARGRESGDHYSGSTAWNNSVRARWALRADGDGLVLVLEKANHAQTGAEIRLRWDAQAHMHVADASPTDGGMVGAIKERTEREAILAAMRACAAAGVLVPAALQGSRTAHNVLAARPEIPDSLRKGRDAGRRFRARLEELRHIAAIEEREIRRGNRHYTLALVLTDRGIAPHAPLSTNE